MELIPGNKYLLEYSGEHCHIANARNDKEESERLRSIIGSRPIEVTFLNKIPQEGMIDRYIFHSEGEAGVNYLMFGSNTSSYILDIDEKKRKELINKFNSLKEEMQDIGLTIELK